MLGDPAVGRQIAASNRFHRVERFVAEHLDGVQYEDLAAALALPLGTVKTQLYRAKQQLRRMLETDLK